MATIVHEYGCRAPTSGGDLLGEQMSLAHRYKNRLIELERDRREAREVVLRQVAAYAVAVAAHAVLEADLEAVREQIARAKAAARRDVGTKALDARAKQLKRDLKAARATRKAALVGAQGIKAAELASIDDATAQARRDARAASGLYWGTYLVVEQAAQAACSGPMPHFSRWDGSGHVAVQVQRTRPLDTKGVFGNDARVQLAPLPEPAEPRTSRAGVLLLSRGPTQRDQRPRYLLRLRIGSHDDRSPIWCELPVILHRPLPAGRITWVHLLRRRLEARDVYRVQFTVEIGEQPLARCGIGAVGVDLGWRVTTDGLRVAYAVGSDRSTSVLVQRPDVVAALRHVEGLRGTRDDNLTAIRAWLVGWLSGRDVPEMIAQARKTLPLWRSHARLAALVLRWRGERWEGDAEGYERAEAWRRRDKHLWTWEVHERSRALGRRREQYRVWAAELARRYEALVIEQFDLRAVAEQKPPEETKDMQVTARYNRVVAAPSVARLALINAFRRRGGLVLHAPAEYTTQRCHSCGERCRWDQEAEIHHTCEHCAAGWDQDLNAARNLVAYASGDAVATAREALAAATPRIGRFQRRAAEKAARREAPAAEVLAPGAASARDHG